MLTQVFLHTISSIMMSDKLFSDKIMAIIGQDQKWLRHILDSKTNGEYYFKHVQFHFSDRTKL